MTKTLYLLIIIINLDLLKGAKNVHGAGFLGKKLPVQHITPEFLFDEGYCTWSGLYPTDQEDSVRERQEILTIAKEDKRRYLEEFRKWSSRRMDRLAREGWRKANKLKEVAA